MAVQASSGGALSAPRARRRFRDLLGASEIDKCLFVLGLTLPFGLAYILRLRYLLAHAEAEPYLSRPTLEITEAALHLAVLWAVGLMLWGTFLRKHARANRLYLHLTLHSWSLMVSLGAYALGLFTSPVIVAFIAGSLIGFLLFDLSSVWWAIGTGTLVTLGSIVAERLGLIPYAPLIASFEHLGGAPSSEWIVGNAIACFLLLFVVYGLSSYIIARWREREAQLAVAYRNVSRLVNAVDHAGEIVLIADATGVVEYVNPAFETITGYEVGEVVGRSPAKLIGTSEYDDRFFTGILAKSRSGEPWSGRIRLRKKDGREADVDATVSCVRGPGGEVQSHVAIVRDVTEKLLLEAQFRQAQKMEALGQLVGGIAHDFNNQLTLVALAVELLRHEEHLSEEGQEALESLVECNEEAAGLTSQLLTFGRKQIDVAEPVPVDPSVVVKRAAGALHRLLGERYKVHLHLDSIEGKVAVSPAQLLQILFNLGVNARDAMPQGGPLNVVVREETLSRPIVHRDATVGPGRYVVIEVRDEGEGIPEAILSRIYEPFFTTKQTRGTGLGLATVYGIVGQAGGAILCDSTVGRGTTFRLYFPRREAAAAAVAERQAPVAPASAGEPKTVLVAEDEVRLLKSAQRILEKAGYRVLAAENVSEALGICDEYEGKIDLLFTDVIMTDGSGSHLAYLFSKSRPDTRVVYTSGYVDDATARRGIAGGEIEFLAKPYTAERLLETIDGALRTESLEIGRL